MEETVIQTHWISGKADEDESTSRSNAMKTLCHHAGVTGCIKDDVGAQVVRGGDDLAPLTLCKLTAMLVRLDDENLTAGSACKKCGAKANRPCTDNKSALAGSRPTPLNSVAANTQCLYESQLVEGQSLRAVKQAVRHSEDFLHAAISMDTQNFEALATVGPACTTGTAIAAIKIRIDRAAIALFNSMLVRSGENYCTSEFMAEHARINISRMPAGIGMKIRSADADALNTDQRPAVRPGG